MARKKDLCSDHKKAEARSRAFIARITGKTERDIEASEVEKVPVSGDKKVNEVERRLGGLSFS